MLCRFIKNQTITCRIITSAWMRAIRGDEWKTVQEWCVIIQILFSFSDVWQGTVLTMDSNYISDSWKMCCCWHWFKSSCSVLPTNAFPQTQSCKSDTAAAGLRRWSSPLRDLHTEISNPAPLLRSLCPPSPPWCAVAPSTCLLSVLANLMLYTQGTYALSSAIQVFNDQSDIKSLILAIWVLCSITLCYFSF